MLNILESRVFPYDDDQQSVTVYQDDEDLNMWYVLPEPQVARRTVAGQSVPEFALVEYNTQDGAAGTCAFVAELSVSPQALAAVHENLGNDITLGQIDWKSGEAYFTYQDATGPTTINVVPSLAGTNRAAFVVNLADQATVNDFKNAFGPGIGVNDFRLDFDVTFLTRLRAVSATVSYDSQLAYEYEKTIDVSKNVWGKETSRRETVKEQLRQSDAGDVEITWGIENPSGELQQRVNDWAWVTLEGLVAKAVDDAMRRIGENNSNQFSLAATASFVRSYEENQVTSFAFSQTGQMAKFTQEEWDEVYSVVENRRLIVGFSILDPLEANDIDSVQVNVKYPTRPTDNSHIFLPGDPTSWVFDADGQITDGSFDPNYEYQYVVKFTDKPGQTFTSDWIPSANTEVVLPVAALGIQKASFVGSNIDFDQVDFAIIDFYFATPGDQPNTAQQQKMVDNTTVHEFVSATFLPSTNEYNYALTYVMKNGTRYVAEPMTVFPPENRNLVTITSPFQTQLFYAAVLNPEDSEKIVQVQLQGIYDDNTNEINDQHTWGFAPNPALSFETATPWSLSVVGNPNGSVVRYNGFLITGDGQQRPVTNLNVQASQPFLNLSAIVTPYSVVIDPSQVQWEEKKISQVVLDLFRLPGDPSESLEAEIQNRSQALNVLVRPVTDENNEVDISAVPEQYYNFNYPVDAPAVYYYTGTYYYEDGTSRSIGEAHSQSQRLVLPSDAPSEASERIFRVCLPPAGAA